MLRNLQSVYRRISRFVNGVLAVLPRFNLGLFSGLSPPPRPQHPAHSCSMAFKLLPRCAPPGLPCSPLMPGSSGFPMAMMLCWPRGLSSLRFLPRPGLDPFPRSVVYDSSKSIALEAGYCAVLRTSSHLRASHPTERRDADSPAGSPPTLGPVCWQARA